MKNGQIQVLIALAFAFVILLTSYLLKGTEYSILVVNALIALYFIPLTYFNRSKRKCCK